jgi:hypothetical protein
VHHRILRPGECDTPKNRRQPPENPQREIEREENGEQNVKKIIDHSDRARWQHGALADRRLRAVHLSSCCRSDRCMQPSGHSGLTATLRCEFRLRIPRREYHGALTQSRQRKGTECTAGTNQTYFKKSGGPIAPASLVKSLDLQTSVIDELLS